MRKPRFFLLHHTLKYSTLPVLIAIYPAIFHYANNAHLVLFSSLLELCSILAGSGLLIYLVVVFISGQKYSQSAIGAVFIIAFFHTYGFVIDQLGSLDLLQIEVYNFLPFWVFAAIYIAWTVRNLRIDIAVTSWNILMLVFGLLIIFNAIKILPVEIEKYKNKDIIAENSVSANNTVSTNQVYPDIYYIIFDEAASFEAARQYWQYKEVDNFVAFLEAKGFYVAEESYAGSTYTLREISARLNYQEYPVGDEYFALYNNALGNNLVMKYLKKHGYTLIAYDERRTPYPTMLPMPVDHLIEESPKENVSRLILLDDYKILVLQSTMLRSFLNQDPDILNHRDMILYTSDHVASAQISSPKFVYVHLMLPHVPFVFEENGNIAASQTEYYNWQRYLGNYEFFLRIAQEMVNNISLTTKGRAIIIIQSDHGVRNFIHHPYTGFLENYPDKYKTWIINALYLPNCEDAPLTQDMDPINTFPIVFNCYFDANIPLK